MSFDMSAVFGVLDLRQGKAVHAIAGRRDEYQPLECELTKDGDPLQLAERYASLGVGGLYVADLDAIEDTGSNACLILELQRIGLPFWIDAGSQYAEATNQMARPVIGTESLSSIDELTKLADIQAILSIDMVGGIVKSESLDIADLSPVEIACQAMDRGVRTLLLLELTSVGGAMDTRIPAICKQIKTVHPAGQIASGGGIRTVTDINTLKSVGCERFLVGTALHGGRKKFLFGDGSC